MASISWAVSGGRVVEIVDGQMRVTDIPVADYNSGNLPYGQVVGEPFALVPHQDSPFNFDQSTRVVPWLEEQYRGNPLPGVEPAGGMLYESSEIDPGGVSGSAPYRFPLGLDRAFYGQPYNPFGPSTVATTTGVGVNTGTGAPKPLAVVGPPDVFIGGILGEVRVVGPGPLVGEGDGIRMGTLPRIVLRDQIGE